MFENLTSQFNGLFGKIASGMCRLTMNGNIAVKCSNPFKLELTHCDEFDNTKEIAKLFRNFNTYESPII